MQMMILASSLLSILVIERVDERVGLSCLISLLSLLLVNCHGLGLWQGRDEQTNVNHIC
jgi:hypothetical protein